MWSDFVPSPWHRAMWTKTLRTCNLFVLVSLLLTECVIPIILSVRTHSALPLATSAYCRFCHLFHLVAFLLHSGTYVQFAGSLRLHLVCQNLSSISNFPRHVVVASCRWIVSILFASFQLTCAKLVCKVGKIQLEILTQVVGGSGNNVSRGGFNNVVSSLHTIVLRCKTGAAWNVFLSNNWCSPSGHGLWSAFGSTWFCPCSVPDLSGLFGFSLFHLSLIYL